VLPSTRQRGLVAEEEAARFLESRGLVVCERNVQIAGSEIDIIAEEPPASAGAPGTVVFVEVRSRGDERSGSPLETVDRRKRAQIRRGATAWLVARGLWERVAVRFDVIGIVGVVGERSRECGQEEAPEIVWIPGAFDADGA